VLDVAMAEIRLQGARVGALVGKLKAAGVPEHVLVGLKPSFAATPSRATILRHPAVAFDRGAARACRHEAAIARGLLKPEESVQAWAVIESAP
jgi:hypothetical protein